MNKILTFFVILNSAGMPVYAVEFIDAENDVINPNWKQPSLLLDETEINSTVEVQVRPDFSGKWVLNEDLSDDIAEKLGEIKSQSRKKASNVNREISTGGRSGRKSGGKGGQMRNKQEGFQTSRQNISNLLYTSKILEVTHEDPMLLIVTDDGNRERVFTDYRGVSVSASGSLKKKIITAGWENEVLVLETVGDTGPNLIQQFRMKKQPKQLVINSSIRLLGLSQPIIVTNVYDYQ